MADTLIAPQKFYKNEDGLLFFRDADWKACLCVPHSLVKKTLQEHHESAWETAHAGAVHLYHWLAYCYYWPSMGKGIWQFCLTCDICQKINLDRQGKKGLLRPHQILLLLWDVVSLNLITGLPKSQGHDAVLVVVDKLSKYVIYIPTNLSLHQEGFAELFINYIMQCYWLPLEMISDQDAWWAKPFGLQ